MARPAKRRRVPETALTADTQDLLGELRNDLGPYGWTVHVEGSRGKNFSFEFRNPLSPVNTGIHFDSDRPRSEVRDEVLEQLNAEPEFARTKTAKPPSRRRALVGGLRWSATSFGWSKKVFEEVIDTLRYFNVITEDEHTWLKVVGPDVLPKDLERKWRQHMRAEQRSRAPELIDPATLHRRRKV
jgi:hypothetical protein